MDAGKGIHTGTADKETDSYLPRQLRSDDAVLEGDAETSDSNSAFLRQALISIVPITSLGASPYQALEPERQCNASCCFWP